MIAVYDEDGEKLVLPMMWAICESCRGEGKSSAHLGWFTGDQLAEDPDFAEEYMGGGYDRQCQECRGDGKIRVVDEDATDPTVLEMYYEAVKCEMEYRQMCEMERRMGA